jgi:hypothetical protein
MNSFFSLMLQQGAAAAAVCTRVLVSEFHTDKMIGVNLTLSLAPLSTAVHTQRLSSFLFSSPPPLLSRVWKLVKERHTHTSVADEKKNIYKETCFSLFSLIDIVNCFLKAKKREEKNDKRGGEKENSIHVEKRRRKASRYILRLAFKCDVI